MRVTQEQLLELKRNETLERRMSGREKRSVVYSFATSQDLHNRKAHTLYINTIPKYECTNNCRFCSRKDAIDGKLNIYENKAGTSLFLAEAPGVEEIIRETEARIKKPFLGMGGTREIAFVGLGEPLLEFNLVLDAIKELRRIGYTGKIRIDTNGQITAFRVMQFGKILPLTLNPALELRDAGLTDIRISVNATNGDDYDRICRPTIGPWMNSTDDFHNHLYFPSGVLVDIPKVGRAFTHVCDFVRDCIAVGINTCASFVVGFNDGEVKTKTAEEYRKFAETLGVKPKNVIIREYVPPIR